MSGAAVGSAVTFFRPVSPTACVSFPAGRTARHLSRFCSQVPGAGGRRPLSGVLGPYDILLQSSGAVTALWRFSELPCKRRKSSGCCCGVFSVGFPLGIDYLSHLTLSFFLAGHCGTAGCAYLPSVKSLALPNQERPKSFRRAFLERLQRAFQPRQSLCTSRAYSSPHTACLKSSTVLSGSLFRISRVLRLQRILFSCVLSARRILFR